MCNQGVKQVMDEDPRRKVSFEVSGIIEVLSDRDPYEYSTDLERWLNDYIAAAFEPQDEFEIDISVDLVPPHWTTQGVRDRTLL